MIIAAAALFAAAGSGAATRAEKIRAKLESPDRDYVFVVMHRGDWRHAPENSVGAIKGSIEHGADIVELDVSKTKDGRYVLLHDDVIDRVTDGKGACADYTLEELRKFRLKSSDGKTLTDYRILSLEEAFDLTRGKILVNLDKFPRDPKGIAECVRRFRYNPVSFGYKRNGVVISHPKTVFAALKRKAGGKPARFAF